MADPALGAKQICPNCQAKFYDLNKRPAHCPKCDTEFDPEEAVKFRRVRTRAVPDYEDEAEDQVKAKKDGEDDEEEEDTTAPEIDEVADEPPLVADDEDGDAEPAPEPDAGVGIEEEDVDLAEDDDSVPFIEDEDEDAFDEDLEVGGDEDEEER